METPFLGWDILRIIMMDYLNPREMLNLALTCTRLYNTLCDKAAPVGGGWIRMTFHLRHELTMDCAQVGEKDRF